jgi:hypothetical protein
MRLAKIEVATRRMAREIGPTVICLLAVRQDWPARPAKANDAAGLLNLDEALLEAFKLCTDLHFQCVL